MKDDKYLMDLQAEIYKASLLEGEVKLRHGGTSDHYFDKYLFESNPDLLKKIAVLMKKRIPEDTNFIAGLEMGGIPLATALSLESGISCVFVRKKAKDYGTCKIAEGPVFDGKKVCVIEDVVTTGGQIIESVRELRKQGAIVNTVLCVIRRDEKANGLLAEEGLRLIPLFAQNYVNGKIKQKKFRRT